MGLFKEDISLKIKNGGGLVLPPASFFPRSAVQEQDEVSRHAGRSVCPSSTYCSCAVGAACSPSRAVQSQPGHGERRGMAGR